MTRFFLLLLGLLFAGGPLFCLLWSVLPPTRYGLWIVGLIAGEWALWLGGMGIIGAGLGGIVAFRFGARGLGGLILCAGLAAFTLSLLPYLQTLPVARANGVVLSWGRYFSRFPARETGKPDATEVYAAPNGVPLALDIYLPPRDAAALPLSRPAIVVVHGGSWKAGQKSDFPQWSRWLAQNGYVVFDVQYRLEPPPNFKQATGDVKAAVLWVKKNATRFHVDTKSVALLGRSAGGHLALLAAYTANDSRLPPTGASGDASVQAVVSLYGPADLKWGYYHTARYDVIDGPGTLRRFLGGDPQTVPENYDLAAPIAHVGPHTPPTLLFHGERDTLVGSAHAKRLSACLQAAHIPYQALYFPYATHGFDYNFDGWGSQVVQGALLRFLRERLGHQ